MGYLRNLFLALTVAVQLVTLAYVLVVMSNSQAFDDNRSIVNSTDARAIYYLATVALIMTAGLAVILWLERRGSSRRTAVVAPSPRSFPVRSPRWPRGDGGGTSDNGDRGGNDTNGCDAVGDGNRDGGGRDRGKA